MTIQGFNINAFKAQYQDLARGYTFLVLITMPSGISTLGTDRIKYLVSTSSMPVSSIEPQEIK
jgi:hypothetical protein